MDLDIQQITEARRVKIGERIRREREKLGATQARLGEIIADMSETSNADGRTKSQGNISDWEQGKRLPSLADLICLTKLFNCDLGYLLCDYDFRTYGEKELSSALGLSPEVINILTTWAKWDIHEYLDALSVLIFDARYNATGHRAVLDLVNFFFSYKRECPPQQILKNGQIAVADADNASGLSAINLSDSTIESAVLVEIQEALRGLKHSSCVKQKGGK